MELDKHGIQSLNGTIVIEESLADYYTQVKDRRSNRSKDRGEGRKDKAHKSILAVKAGKATRIRRKS